MTARGSDAAQARARCDALAEAMRARLGIDVYGSDDDSLAVVVGRLLVAQGATVAVLLATPSQNWARMYR